MLMLLLWYVGEKSPETNALRKKVSDGCEKLIWDFFANGGQVVIYDANNGTRKARQALAEKFSKEGIHVVMLGECVETWRRSQDWLFLESICDNDEIIKTNIRNVKISSPDVRSHLSDRHANDYLIWICSTVDGIQKRPSKTITNGSMIMKNTMNL